MKEHKKLFYAFSSGAYVPLCTLFVLLHSCTEIKPLYEKPRVQTALFAYMLADNDLELFALRDVNEMEQVLASALWSSAKETHETP